MASQPCRRARRSTAQHGAADIVLGIDVPQDIHTSDPKAVELCRGFGLCQYASATPFNSTEDARHAPRGDEIVAPVLCRPQHQGPVIARQHIEGRFDRGARHMWEIRPNQGHG